MCGDQQGYDDKFLLIMETKYPTTTLAGESIAKFHVEILCTRMTSEFCIELEKQHEFYYELERRRRMGEAERFRALLPRGAGEELKEEFRIRRHPTSVHSPLTVHPNQPLIDTFHIAPQPSNRTLNSTSMRRNYAEGFQDAIDVRDANSTNRQVATYVPAMTEWFGYHVKTPPSTAETRHVRHDRHRSTPAGSAKASSNGAVIHVNNFRASLKTYVTRRQTRHRHNADVRKPTIWGKRTSGRVAEEKLLQSLVDF
jgi:hypothetical protein